MILPGTGPTIKARAEEVVSKLLDPDLQSHDDTVGEVAEPVLSPAENMASFQVCCRAIEAETSPNLFLVRYLRHLRHNVPVEQLKHKNSPR